MQLSTLCFVTDEALQSEGVPLQPHLPPISSLLPKLQDMIQIGRCERMVVIAGDDASGEALLPWIGNGFRALGAASVAADPEEAALPFDVRRNGMLLGAGGIGMVLETEVRGDTRGGSFFL